jgi:hypothetical protein
MTKIKRFIILPVVLLAAVLPLAGCFGFGGYGAPQSTVPPQKDFKTIEEFKQAVETAKADASATDEENLKGVTFYYDFKAVPENAEVQYVKVSAQAIRIGYKFGETSETNFDNQMEILWYRDRKAADYLSNITQSQTQYETYTAGDLNYIYNSPDFQFIVTPAPGDTAAATPTPMTEKFATFAYWVQGDDCFIASMPLGYGTAEIGKYCEGVKHELN